MICFLTDKLLQVLLSNTNCLIRTLLNGSKYSYVTITIQFDISYLFATVK